MNSVELLKWQLNYSLLLNNNSSYTVAQKLPRDILTPWCRVGNLHFWPIMEQPYNL